MGKIKGLAKIVLGSFLLFAPLEKVFGQAFQDVKDKPVIVIDPGHGGDEFGSDNRPILESVLNLGVSNLAYDKLYHKFNVFLTRNSDSCVNKNNFDYSGNGKLNLTDELLSRIEYAKSKNPDYIISLHFNASKDTSKRGVQIFYPAIYNQKGIDNNKTDFCANNYDCGSYSEESYEFAEDLGNFFRLNGFPVDVCGADYRILIGNQRNREIKYPLKRIVLLELGYMSNDVDYKNMITLEGKDKYASLIQDFFNYLYPEKLEMKEIKINYGKQIYQSISLR